MKGSKKRARVLIGGALALLIMVAVTGQSFAQSTIWVNGGYWKGNGAFDLVVKEMAGSRLKLYINDKNPTTTTTNKQGWATFRKVKLSGSGKLSFTQIFNTNNRQTEKPINYTRHFAVTGHQISFTAMPAPAKPTSVATTPASTPAVATAPASPPANTGVNDPDLSNSNTYVNSNGNSVHSPAASTNGSVPAGATAQCNDGTYSFSQHHSGTCSGHGGVATWL